MKKVLLLVLAAVLLISLGIAVLAAGGGYSDVSDGDWYAEAVKALKEKDLMNGVGGGRFDPDGVFTRAQLATVLYRMAGSPAVSGDDGFSDTAPGKWYSDAVLWASENGVVNGYGDGRFGTNDAATQEQVAVMLWRDAGSYVLGPEYADENGVENSAGAWAEDAVRWARVDGLLTDAIPFEPKADASRAQVADMVYRYMQLLERFSDTDAVSGATSRADGGNGSEEPTVYFTADISAEGLVKIYEALGWEPQGKVAVKISTGEPPASNYLRPELIGDLVKKLDGTIVECNTAYGGSRSSSAMHKQVAKDHGFTDIAGFDLMDEEGTMEIPADGAKHLKGDIVGSHFDDYDCFLILSHFKGHAMAGYGGAIKNTSIGIASPSGKARIHSGGKSDVSIWGGTQDDFLESMAEAAKAVSDYLGEGERIVYINVMNRLSIDCDCDGNPAEPDIHDIGILASTDPVALDQACMDLIFDAEGNASFVNRVKSLNGIHTIEYAEEIGLGSRAYKTVSIDD